jgi:hypothetical protein
MGAQQGRRPRELRGHRHAAGDECHAYGECPGIMTAAEESTAFPGCRGRSTLGGLGFGFKWNMGWMNDTLSYMRAIRSTGKYHHNQMTFGLIYAWSENFILPISHDEVVHGKGSMLGKMPGDRGRNSPTCGPITASCGRIRARSCCSWGRNSPKDREWNHARASTGTSSTIPPMPACSAGPRPEPALPRDSGAACERLPARGLRVDGGERCRGLGLCLGAQGAWRAIRWWWRW